MGQNFEKKQLIKKSKNTPAWYTDVILLAKLADYGPARGTMVIRPYGYAIWEFVQEAFNRKIKKLGVENAYFPLLIPMSLLNREKEHIEGFAPQLAVVTHGGGKKLEEPLAVRPTSETMMYEMYARWIQSWRDLPLLINQWNNVVRWEKRTYLFLRTSEFLWQEGHTAHATSKDAEEMALQALNAYRELYEEFLAMPGLIGMKSDAEKFAGADHTYAIEFLMPDGKVLQGATSHHLGNNFSKVFGISYQDKSGKSRFVYQTSWGLSTRSIGGMILMHGDDKGLILPPKIAPVKVVIIPILGKKDKEILRYCDKLKAEIETKNSLFPGKTEVDSDPEKSFGWKVNEAEIRGIPIRVSVGRRELDEKTVTLTFRTDEPASMLVRSIDIAEKVEEMLAALQSKIYERAKKELDQGIHKASDYNEFKKIMKTERGFIKAYWCEDAKCEGKIKEETKATTRLLPITGKSPSGKCIYCGRKANHLWYFGQAY
jgi:prolyl-tRNA synthetase